MPRTIMHIDMDAFFAAIEIRERPCFQGRPLIVGALPVGRGVVTTCSYEARRFGVHSAMPIAEAYRRCPEGVYVRPRHRLYSEVSDQVMAILSGVSPMVEPVSIDEAYLDITGMTKLLGSPEAIGRLVKARIKAATQLTASVGIGPNRLIAKIASDRRKPDGLTVVTPDRVQAFLDPLPVKCLRGVGPKMQAAIRNNNIETVYELRLLSEETLKRKFGESAGTMLFRQSRGIGSDRVGDPHGRKSISKERTFSEDVTDIEIVRETLLRLAGGVGRVARNKGVRGCVVSVKIRLTGFETHTRQRKLEQGINSDRKIFEIGWELFTQSGFAHRPVRLIGIGISDWDCLPGRQIPLFAKTDEKEERLYKAMDRIADRFGRDSIGMGTSGRKQKR